MQVFADQNGIDSSHNTRAGEICCTYRSVKLIYSVQCSLTDHIIQKRK